MSAKLGQHFLQDTQVVSRIIAALTPHQGETVIEIGAGHGELTFALAESCARVGAKLLAIEKDGALAKDLRIKIDELRMGDIEILTGDVRTVLKPYIINHKSYSIVGNIPYYLTGHLLRLIGSCIPLPRITALMMQKEVAARAVLRAPQMNKLAASLALWADASILMHIPRSAFMPPPKVESAVLTLTPRANLTVRDATQIAREDRAIFVLFAHPRKTVGNNLRDAAKLPRTQLGSLAPEEFMRLTACFSKENFSLTRRPQELDAPLIARIATLL